MKRSSSRFVLNKIIKRIVCVAISLFLSSSFLIAQKSKVLIDNKNAKYIIKRKGLEIDSTGKVMPTTYLVCMDINKKLQKRVASKTYSNWVELLTDEKTDWATNLILYCVFKKDAFLFSSAETNREEWVRASKEEDVKYWKNFLKEKVK